MERRRHFRVQALHPILYYKNLSSRPTSGLTINLSLEGIAIETRHPLSKDELIDISITLDSRLMNCSGKVVYVQALKGKRFQAGIRFKEMSKEDRLYLEKHISYLIDQQDKKAKMIVCCLRNSLHHH